MLAGIGQYLPRSPPGTGICVIGAWLRQIHIHGIPDGGAGGHQQL